jgi:hypothetical protein
LRFSKKLTDNFRKIAGDLDPGLNACFFQKNWALMGKEVCSGILHILNYGQMPHALNLTHIALIPKIKNPESVANFRPISLCNVLYKLVSKVLANRLKIFLPFVISPSQSAFIPGRLISDNVLAAYETLHTMHMGMRGKKAFMTVKLDMSKAYNRVEWRFLEAVMRKMGFNERWIHLVMMCVSLAHYAILVNGEPRGHIFPTRGIRQGDPISPYLFLMCAEALSPMVKNANQEGLLTGVSTSCGGPKISHIFFADDSFLFCRTNLAQWSNMTAILKNYEEASGQKMNTNKTAIFFSKNTPKLVKETILEFAGIPKSYSYDKYLGLSALVGRSRTQAFKSIIERVRKQLQDWKLRFLSQAGKEILLKAVIQAIPSYCMGIFLLPKTLCMEINSLMSRFWWGHKEKDKRIAWLSWKNMRISKKDGGMGFRDLTCFNKALLAKQVWRMWSSSDSLIARIMKSKYFPYCSILKAKVKKKSSFAWRSIQGSCALIKEGLVWRIGNGQKVRIWEDKWLPSLPTNRVQSFPSLLDLKATVNHLLDLNGLRWKTSLLERLFTEEENTAIQSLAISTTNQEDRLIWRGTVKGTFSVKSAYYIQKEWETMQEAGCSSRQKASQVWKELWKLDVPNVDKVFFWRACKNILPTRENLFKRKIISDHSCPVCGIEEETISHILWQCPSAQDVWSVGCRKFQKSFFPTTDFIKVAEGMLMKCDPEEFQLFVGIARRIWLRRNSLIHEEIFAHPNEILHSATTTLSDFHQEQELFTTGESQVIPSLSCKWTAPPLGWVKANWDAAVNGKNWLGWAGSCNKGPSRQSGGRKESDSHRTARTSDR